MAALASSGAYAGNANCGAIGKTRDCWQDYSGPNFGQVEVAPGLLCAVFAAGPVFYQAFTCGPPGGDPPGPGFSPSAIPPNMSTIFGNTSSNRVLSISMRASADTDFGPTDVYVMRTDGYLFKATVDVRFRDGRDSMTNLSQVTRPLSVAGESLTFRWMTAVRGQIGSSSGNTVAVGVTTSNQVFYSDGGRWIPAISDLSLHYAGPPEFLMFGGPYGAISLDGTSASATGLSLWSRGTQNAPPPVPSGVHLARRLTGFLDDFGFPTHPIALGNQDAWLVTDELTNPDHLIMRSPRHFDNFGPWEYYPTAPYSDQDTPQILPWSIVDAMDFTGMRGSLAAIGDDYHLTIYYP